MATGWSDYQVTQGYLEWFYDVKFAVVTLIALGFGWYSISRVIDSLKSHPSQKNTGSLGPEDEGTGTGGKK
jgi:hypothetical protein